MYVRVNSFFPHYGHTESSRLKATVSKKVLLVHDAGLTLPADEIAINDTLAILAVEEQKADALTHIALSGDTELRAHVRDFTEAIGTTTSRLISIRRKMRTKAIKRRARLALGNTLPPTVRDMATHILSPLSSTNLAPHHQCALLRARHFALYPPLHNCEYCHTEEPHTLEHAAHTCTYPPLVNARNRVGEIPPVLHTLSLRNQGPHTHAELTTILDILQKTPHYYPPQLQQSAQD